MDGAIDQRLAQQHAGVIDQIPGGKVVRAIADDVVGTDQLQGVIDGQQDLVNLDPAVGIEISDAVSRRAGLGPSDPGATMNHLPLQVRHLNYITIHNADRADSRCRQIQQKRRSKATAADAQHRCALQPFLTGAADLREDQMPGIAMLLVRGQRRMLLGSGHGASLSRSPQRVSQTSSGTS